MKPRTFYCLESISDQMLDHMILEVIAEGKGDGLKALQAEKNLRCASMFDELKEQTWNKGICK